MPRRPNHLSRSRQFPKLAKDKNAVTSDADPQYNCIAYAAGITTKKYWPDAYPDYIWPAHVPRLETIDAFVKFYEEFGYQIVQDGSGGDYIPGIVKIAIYVTSSGVPTHAAIQRGRNKWASKLGNWYDIEHAIDAVSGGDYGEVAVFMQKSI
jgi:hypothetical protein